MDWSKKIGISILLVLILTACSARKNYGSVYLAGGDVFDGTEMKYDMSASDYMEYSDSVNNDIKSLSRYENEFIDIADTIITSEDLTVEITPKSSLTWEDAVLGDTLIATEMNSADTLETNSLVLNQKGDNDTVFVNTIELVKIDSSSVFIDSSNVKDLQPSDSIFTEEKLGKATGSTKIIYTDTIGLIRKKELENKINTDSKTESKKEVDGNSVKVNNVTLVNLASANSNKENALSDSTKNNNESTEGSNFDNKAQTQKAEKEVDSKKIVTAVPIITNENKEVKTDTVTVIKENPTYKKEIDSLKTVNDKLRSKAKSNADTLVYSVFFDSGQHDLSKRNKEILNTLIKDAKNKNYALQLSGHTDKSGSADYNKVLSENRVKSVFNYIVANGLDEKNIFYQAFGEKYASNQSDLNQRIVSCRLVLSINN